MRTYWPIAVAFGAILLPIVVAQDRAIHSHGRLEVPQTYSFNLDWGIWGYDSPDAVADFRYEAADRNTRYLRAVNSAGLAVAGNKSIGYAGCSAAHFSRDGTRVESLKTGTFLCARTSAGRIAEFSYDGLEGRDPVNPDSRLLAITYTTWEN